MCLSRVGAIFPLWGYILGKTLGVFFFSDPHQVCAIHLWFIVYSKVCLCILYAFRISICLHYIRCYYIYIYVCYTQLRVKAADQVGYFVGLAAEAGIGALLQYWAMYVLYLFIHSIFIAAYTSLHIVSVYTYIHL